MAPYLEKYKEEFIVSAIFLFFAFAFNVYRVQSDGMLYYSFLETLLHIPNRESQYVAGFQQAGCAFLNAPFYLLTYAVENILHKTWNFNGITLRQASINIATNFYMVLSLCFTVKILKQLNFKSRILPVISVLFSTSAFCVAVIMPSFNHTADIFVSTLFFYLLLSDSSWHMYRAFSLGLLCVFGILVRYSSFILIAPALFFYYQAKEYRKIKYFLFGFFCTCWVIPLLFYFYNGSVFSPLLNATDTVNTVQLLSCYPKNLLKYLLHPLHGLFLWSPVTVLSALGLFLMPKKEKSLGYILLVAWLMQLFLLGFLPFWSAGWSFSNRYLANLFPIYIIGLSAMIERYGRKIIFLTLILTLYSIVLFLNWQLCIMNAEFGTPGNIIKAWWHGESPSFLDRNVNLKTFFNRLFEYCRYKYLFKIIK